MNSLRSVSAAVSSGMRSPNEREAVDRPFVTISREAGVDAGAAMHALLSRLREAAPAKPEWTGWHRELAERAAQEHGVSEFLAKNLLDQDHSMLRDLLEGFSITMGGPTTEVAVYHRVAATLRALARAGHAVIVGGGGVLITRDMSQGVHLRLVAPRRWRVMRYAETAGISEAEAKKRVREIDHNRDAFFRKYWPHRPLTPATFTATYNLAEMSLDAWVDSAAPLVLKHRHAPTA